MASDSAVLLQVLRFWANELAKNVLDLGGVLLFLASLRKAILHLVSCFWAHNMTPGEVTPAPVSGGFAQSCLVLGLCLAGNLWGGGKMAFFEAKIVHKMGDSFDMKS